MEIRGKYVELNYEDQYWDEKNREPVNEKSWMTLERAKAIHLYLKPGPCVAWL